MVNSGDAGASSAAGTPEEALAHKRKRSDPIASPTVTPTHDAPSTKDTPNKAARKSRKPARLTIDPETEGCKPHKKQTLECKYTVADKEALLKAHQVDLARFDKSVLKSLNIHKGEALALEIQRIQVNFKVLVKQALGTPNGDKPNTKQLHKSVSDQLAHRAAQFPTDDELQKLVDAEPPWDPEDKVSPPSKGKAASMSDPNDVRAHLKPLPSVDVGMNEDKFWAIENARAETKMAADKKQWLETGLGPDGQPLTFNDLPADDFFDEDNQADSNVEDEGADYSELSRALAAFKEEPASNEEEQEIEDGLFKKATEKSAAYNHNKWLLKLIVRNAQEHVEDRKNTRGRFNFHPEYKYPYPPKPTELELALGDYKQEKGYLRDAQGQWVIGKQLQKVVIRMEEHVHDMLKCCRYGTKSPEELALFLDTLPTTVRVKDAVLKNDVNSTDSHVRYVKSGKANEEKYAKFKRDFLECREELIEEFEAITIWEEEFESHEDRAARFIVEEQFPAISFFNVTTECTVWNALVHY
jgi:hypothetical protein